jgi:dTDP-4-amino-4,6-dideoxygalactose transaminase
MFNPYTVVKDFEAALSDYTGAPYVVTTTSCTMALLIALRWHLRDASLYRHIIEIPKRTYVGVAMSILNSGARVSFRDEQWRGEYRLNPTPIWDSARRFTSGMYLPEEMQTVSFHWSKTLGIGQGGAILHDNSEADAWLRRARFDGRTEGVPPSKDEPTSIGYHAYMMPRDAAEGLSKLAVLPRENADIPWDDYPDLSTFNIFK